MEDVLRQWENRECSRRLYWAQLSSCLLAERPQKSWRRYFFMTVTLLLSNRFQRALMTLGINPLSLFFTWAKCPVLHEGVNTAHCGDEIGEVKNGWGRCSGGEQGNVVQSLHPVQKEVTEWSWQKSSYASCKSWALPDQKMSWLPNAKDNFFRFVYPQSISSNEKKKRRR